MTTAPEQYFRDVHCLDCGKVVARLAVGSKIHPKAVHRCIGCEQALQAKLGWGSQFERQFDKTFKPSQKH